MTDILLVDDEQPLLRILSRTLERAGYGVVSADSVEAALAHAAHRSFDIVITDLKIQEADDGLKVAQGVRALQSNIGVLIITAYATVPSAVEAMRMGADDYLMKPVETEELLVRIAGVLERRQLRREVQKLRSRLCADRDAGVIGAETGLKAIFGSLDRVALSDLPVLVQGESGTGKELVARAVHEHSNRQGRAFVAVNCAAMPEHLLESELFGHVQGAFTGADRARRGLFEEAHNGTLFLDEIGDISPALQVRLLRVLQEQEIRPVGANVNRKVDVRVIAATHHDLAARVRDGGFRDDLYFRLNVLPLMVPSLRSRRDDIPELTAYFVERHCSKAGRPVPHLTAEAIRKLAAYQWPGNVRELRNVIERSLTLAADTDVLDAADIRLDIGAHEGDWDVFRHLPRLMSLADLERHYFSYVLECTQGNQVKAAEILQVGKNTVWRRMRDQRSP
ncbi:MAG: sigma-54 dependent transcriptional regulator [Gammaproteobacteria bacterium]|nr:sigma-54 dependent transcriptional regulator [Gammaproteobacteria bacterium]